MKRHRGSQIEAVRSMLCVGVLSDGWSFCIRLVLVAIFNPFFCLTVWSICHNLFVICTKFKSCLRSWCLLFVILLIFLWHVVVFTVGLTTAVFNCMCRYYINFWILFSYTDSHRRVKIHEMKTTLHFTAAAGVAVMLPTDHLANFIALKHLQTNLCQWLWYTGASIQKHGW